MSSIDRLDAALPELLADLVVPGSADDLDLILTRSAAVKQRPAWSFTERWFPVSAIARTVRATAPVPWRLAGALALLILALLAAYAVVGGQPARPAPPLGLAANGAVAFVEGTQLITVEPSTGRVLARIDGAAAGQTPMFSPDGTRLAYARAVDGGTELVVAKADGTQPVVVTPEPLFGLDAWSFAPDGRTLVALARMDDASRLVILTADGSQPPRVLPANATHDDTPPRFRPTDGGAILYLEVVDGRRAVATIDVATERIDVLVESTPTYDIHMAQWSPDGTRIVYGAHDPTDADADTRSYLLRADGTGSRLLDDAPDTVSEIATAWSNDGTRIVLTRFITEADPGDVVIAPVEGDAPEVTIACPTEFPACMIDVWTWSPDDRLLLGVVNRLHTITIDASTGISTLAPWTTRNEPTFQRVGP